MTISCWDSFTAYDWDRYARLFSYVTSAMAMMFAIITWAFQENWHTAASHSAGVGVWSFIISLFIVFQETPLLNGPCVTVKMFCDDTLQWKRPVVLGCMYGLSSILCI